MLSTLESQERRVPSDLTCNPRRTQPFPSHRSSDDCRSERVYGYALLFSSRAPICRSQPRVPLQIRKIHQVETTSDNVDIVGRHSCHGVGTRSACHVSNSLYILKCHNLYYVRYLTWDGLWRWVVLLKMCWHAQNTPDHTLSVACAPAAPTFSMFPSRAGLAAIASRAIPSL